MIIKIQPQIILTTTDYADYIDYNNNGLKLITRITRIKIR